MKNNNRGFTITEVMIAMTILVILGTAVISSTMTLRLLAENNLRQSTAQAVASGYLEQMVGIPYAKYLEILDDPENEPFPTEINQGEPDPIYLDTPKTVEVPIFTDFDESTGEPLTELTMDLTLTARMTNLRPTSNIFAMAIELEFAWEDPTTRKTNTRILRTIRADLGT